MLKEDHCYIQFGRCSCFSHIIKRYHYPYRRKDAYRSLYSAVSLEYLAASSCLYTCRHIFPSNENRQEPKIQNIKYSEPLNSFNYWLPFTLNHPNYISGFPFLNLVTSSAKVAPRSNNTSNSGFLVVAMNAEKLVLYAIPILWKAYIYEPANLLW